MTDSRSVSWKSWQRLLDASAVEARKVLQRFGTSDERRDSKTLLGELLVKDIRSAGAETKLGARDMKPHDMVDYNDLVDYDFCYVENSYVACWHPRRSAEYRLPPKPLSAH